MLVIQAANDVVEVIITIVVFGVIIGFSVVSKLIAKFREAGNSSNYAPGKASPVHDLWQPQDQTAAAAAAGKQRSKPPPLPSNSAKAKAVAKARQAMESAMQQQTAEDEEPEERNAYDAEEYNGLAYHEDAYDDQADAYSEESGRKRRRRRHKVLSSLRDPKGARQAIIAREILQRPRAFDI